ncbi:hypothetical protein [Paenibacillus sp. 1P07SE]|uniref:hypothetical protein n=1 Tax=Paenibacillus sp. 1P07SE TaxID=3132209 RepID=UPI0039A73BB4
MKGGEGSASRVQALLSGSRYDGLSVLQALTSDERGAHLLGVTVKRGERVQGIQLLACHVSSCELELLRFMIQLEQGGAAASEWMSYTPGDTLALPEAVRICGNQLDGASRRWFLLYVSDSQQYVLLRQGLN